MFFILGALVFLGHEILPGGTVYGYQLQGFVSSLIFRKHYYQSAHFSLYLPDTLSWSGWICVAR